MKDKKFYIKFIGDFTSANVSAENLCLFEEGISKNYHISKKKTLLNAFKEAKEQFKAKEGKTSNKLDKIISKRIDTKGVCYSTLIQVNWIWHPNRYR